ncbi:hypothetical protein [Actinoplanes sp. CA-252034]|uniref:hypothetical protein n=1 Tax=Actinoplanes sp. CA-252034 TaxID=3239906 RepID=UPI003D9524B3
MPRWITAWRIERVSLPCRLPRHEALRHIAAGIDGRYQHSLRQHLFAEVDFVILGRAVDDDDIRICAARPHIQNSYRTYLHARLVSDGAGSRLEGHLGWLPSVRLFFAVQVVGLALLWCGLAGFVGRSLLIGSPLVEADDGPFVEAVGGMVLIPLALAGIVGLAALCARLARPEAAHLRAWLAARLDIPAPAPAPIPPAPDRIRPPAPT